MNQAWMNGIEGIGEAQVVPSRRGLKTCNGWFTPPSAGVFIELANKGTATFRGVVIENGKETICKFNVILERSVSSSANGSRIYFTATGDPYS